MSRRKTTESKTPELRTKKNRSGDRCYATFNKQKFWFGAADDPKTRVLFDAFLARWLANGRKLEDDTDVEDLTVRDMCDGYECHIESKHGKGWLDPQGTGNRTYYAIRALLALYGHERVTDFGPKKLKAVRQSMIESGTVSRKEINMRIVAARSVFKWAVSEEIISGAVLEALRSVDGLRDDRCLDIPKHKPRMPVPKDVVWETMKHLGPMHAAIIELLWITGARPGEIVLLKPREIDRSDDACWVAKLEHHKTAHHGEDRYLHFAERAQEILRPYLDRVPRPAPDRPLFDPRLGLAEHQADRRSRRVTPLRGPEDLAEREEARRGRGVKPRKLLDHYTHDALRAAVERAIKRANAEREEPLPYWTPYQLRHSLITHVTLEQGAAAAEALAGHTNGKMTEHYAKMAKVELARRAAIEMG